MTNGNEFERHNLEIDREMELSDDNPHQIVVYIETWFDVDKKFNIHTDADEGTWLNMYGKYDPYADTLHIDCVISSDDSEETFSYEPTESESALIKSMIAEKIRQVWDKTPLEFCESLQDYSVYLCPGSDSQWSAVIATDAPTGNHILLTNEHSYPVEFCFERYDIAGSRVLGSRTCQDRAELLESLNWHGSCRNIIRSLWDFDILKSDNEQVLELFRNCGERRQQIAQELIEMFKGDAS